MESGQVGYLVKQTKKGDQAAFTELVELYSERIYNLGLRILKNPDDAADILQETFIAVYEKIHSFDGRSNFFTWLYRIATNFALMKLRKEKRTIYTDQDMEEQFDDPEKMWRYSPLAYVRNIRTPLMILHSDNDYRVPIIDAEQLFTALKRLNRKVEFVRYPRDGHELSRSGEPKHRVDRLERMTGWFDKYCKPRKVKE